MKVPTRIISHLIEIVKWNIKEYDYEEYDKIVINRLLDDLCVAFNHREESGANTEIDKRYDAFLREVVSNAINYAEECGVDKETIWEIFDIIK